MKEALALVAAVVGSFILMFALTVLVMCIPVGIFYLIWNAILPDLFGAPHITFLQGFGLVILLSFFRTAVRIGGGKKG